MSTTDLAAQATAAMLGLDGVKTATDLNTAMALEEATETLNDLLSGGARFSDPDLEAIELLISLLTAEVRRLNGIGEFR